MNLAKQGMQAYERSQCECGARCVCDAEPIMNWHIYSRRLEDRRAGVQLSPPHHQRNRSSSVYVISLYTGLELIGSTKDGITNARSRIDVDALLRQMLRQGGYEIRQDKSLSRDEVDNWKVALDRGTG